MKLCKVSTIYLLLIVSICCSHPNKQEQASKTREQIDNYLTKTMALHHIPGLALAVVKGDQVVFKNYYGKASLEEDILVNEKTLFRVFSTTKLITSVGAFQLIANGALNLDDPISRHLDDLPIPWQGIKIKNLLSHSSGLPDLIKHPSTLSDEALIDKLSQEPISFAAGEQFSYNQTNYWLLDRIIEKITASPFDQYILKNQFNTATDGVVFSSNALETIPNRANRYYYNPKTKGFIRDRNNNGERGHSGNGLNITLNHFIEWDKKLKSNQLLGDLAKSKMWEPFQFAHEKDHFLHGWNIYNTNQLESFGFSGGNLAAFRVFPNQQTTIILLSNGYKTAAFDIIVNDVARMFIPEIKTKNPMLEEDVFGLVLNHQLEKAMQGYDKLKEENPKSRFENLKWNINSIGNSYSWDDRPEKAFEIFSLNATVNPDWWVAISALAESYDDRKDTLNALKNYKKAILLNEKNELDYNKTMKSRIGQLTKQ